MSADRMGGRKPTVQLLMIVSTICVGTFFPNGYALTAINTPQAIIVNWIRGIHCHRTYADVSNVTALNNNSDEYMWCRPTSEEEDGAVLKENHVLNSLWAVIGSIFGAGTLVSILCTSALRDRFGNRGTLLIANCTGVVGALMCALCGVAGSYELLILGRFMYGLCNGPVTVIAPIYFAEVSPTKLRGAIGCFPMLFFVLGMVVSTLVGVPQIFGTPDLWTNMYWIQFVCFASIYLFLPFCPESPRYLLTVKKDRNAARKALEWLRGKKDVTAELDSLELESNTSDNKQPTSSVLAVLKNPYLRRILFLCIMIMFAQQLSGIAAIHVYSTSILLSAGLEKTASFYGSVSLRILELISITSSLFIMDRVGRRPLLLLGCVGCFLADSGMLVFMAVTANDVNCSWCRFGGLGCLLIFIVVQSVGLACVPWVLSAELFPQTARGSAMSVISLCCIGSSMGVAFAFPFLQTLIDEYVFAVFAGFMGIFTLYVYFSVIETSGKSFDDIQAELRKKFYGIHGELRRDNVTVLSLAESPLRTDDLSLRRRSRDSNCSANFPL